MKISTLLLLLPITFIAVVIAVANRGTVIFGLDPFSGDESALSFAMPLFLLVFLVFFLGVLVGGATVAFQRGRKRRARDTARHVGTALTAHEAKPMATDPAAQNS